MKVVWFLIGFMAGMLFVIIVSCRIIAGQVDIDKNEDLVNVKEKENEREIDRH